MRVYIGRHFLEGIKYCVPLIAAIGLVSPLYAVDKSTYSFNSGMNCNGVYPIPDTGQTVSYTTTLGEDHDYQPAATQMSYTVHADNTITDNVTGLVWRRCSQGKNDDATCTGTAPTYTWENAISQCANEAADGGGWRLPNIKELFSIVNLSGSAPYIDQAAFPATVTGYYWSSTTYVPSTTSALYVPFGSGYVVNGGKTSPNYVRCVRAGP
jgi:hypothetical protein